jgi:hypothetical protein
LGYWQNGRNGHKKGMESPRLPMEEEIRAAVHQGEEVVVEVISRLL